jgi:hypothetical protein
MPALPSGTPAVSIGDGALWYDDQPVTVSRWFTPNRVARGGLSRHPTAPGRADDYLECWGDQLGAGEGLTPYGDDVICGVMLGLIAADDRAADSLAAQIRAADLESRTTAVSAALLRCACDGWCIPEIARVLEALASRRDPGAAVQRLLAVGHTSGEGLLAGLATVLDLRRPGLAA